MRAIVFVLLALGCKPRCPDEEVRIEEVSTEISPDGRHVAHRYLESGGGAAGFMNYAINLEDAAEPFHWCRNVVATSKRCSGELAWKDARTLVITCRHGWESDPYWQSQRKDRLGEISIEYR